jgi:transcriptional regulator with XRE-family HTH domain
MFLIDAQIFAANMRHFRDRQSFTYSELSRQTLLPVWELEALERGGTVPNTAQLRRIAQVLGVRESELVMPRPIEHDDFEAC